MEIPKIKNLKREDILKEIKAKAPFFTPEWSHEDETDFGLALSKVFTEMYAAVIERLNTAQLRHYLSFLETIESNLLPAQPARVPLTFVPSSGAKDNIIVPASTQASAKDDEGNPVVFETDSSFVVTPSKLTRIVSVIPWKDSIMEHSCSIDGSSATRLFDEDNKQSHILYIGDKDIFNIKKGQICIRITGKGIDAFKSRYVVWKYIPDTEDNKENDWSGSFTVETEENDGIVIKLEKESDTSVKETEIKGIKSRWIRCSIKTDEQLIEEGIEPLKAKKDIRKLMENIEIKSISISAALQEKISYSIKKVHGIGDEFYERLAGKTVKDKIETIDELLKLTPEELKNRLKCPLHRAQNILEAAKKAFYDKTGEVSKETIQGIKPDAAFYNDVPVNLEKEFYPFGKKPQLYDTFYIASDEVLSKKGYTVQLILNLKPGIPSDTNNSPQLSWEYWDGETWSGLDISYNLAESNSGCNNNNSRQFVDHEVKLKTPPEICKTTVNGKEHYWIRIRLVGGNYGKEYKVEKNMVKPGHYCPPVIRSIRLTYTNANADKQPEHIITENNLYQNEENIPFKPFKPISDIHPTIYFGFDSPLKGGPYSMYIDVDSSYAYPEGEDPPRIKWEYYTGNEEGTSWSSLDVVDETRGFTRSGTIQFLIDNEMKSLTLFGEEQMYWIRGVVKENFWLDKDFNNETSDKASEADTNQQSVKEQILNCNEELRIFNISFASNLCRNEPPQIRGFYLNTTWATQTETVEDEIVGSSNGQPNQIFTLSKTPVTEEALWINEIRSLSEAERKELVNSGFEIDERYDEEGNLSEFWIRWSEVSSFINSGPEDRHYRIDRTSGEISFGDGTHGMIPPIDSDNIKVSYKTGGGSKGNLPKHEISQLQSSVAYIDKVFNPIASSGGCDTEDTDSLIKRGPTLLRHRQRAVGSDDFLNLVKEASRKIARVKILPNLNEKGDYETGAVTAIVVPYSTDKKPIATPILKNEIKRYIEERASNLVNIFIIDPAYVKVNVYAELTTEDIDKVPIIESEARERIKEFLHPIEGGTEGKGWDFGTTPCISDIYSLFEEIEGVDYVNRISLTLVTEDGSTLTISDNTRSTDLIPSYALTYCGEIDIKVLWTNKEAIQK